MGKEYEYEGTQQYSDIINLPHPVSGTHPPMSMAERAAQFSPFAALTGHKDAIRETERLTEEWTEPDEGEREELDRRLSLLAEALEKAPKITVTFFEPDERKAGGTYRSVTGNLKKIDAYGHRLLLSDGTEIPMEYVVEIDGELFGAF